MRNRAAREAVVADKLEWLRVHRPERFAEAMRILARLVAEARARQAVH